MKLIWNRSELASINDAAQQLVEIGDEHNIFVLYVSKEQFVDACERNGIDPKNCTEEQYEKWAAMVADKMLMAQVQHEQQMFNAVIKV